MKYSFMADTRKYRYLMLDSLEYAMTGKVVYFEISEEDFNDVVVRFRDLYKMRYDFNGSYKRIFTDINTGLDDYIVETLN